MSGRPSGSHSYHHHSPHNRHHSSYQYKRAGPQVQHNPYQYNSFNVSPGLVLLYVACGLAIIYNLLQHTLSLPPLWLLPIYPFRRMLGRKNQERIEKLFGDGLGILKQGGGRIINGFGGGLRSAYPPPGILNKDWEGWVGGLYNTGNTCYQNSVLQAMASCKNLPEHLYSIIDERYSVESETVMSSTAQELDTLLRDLNTPGRSPHSQAAPFALRMITPSNSWYHEQQDAQEFYQKLTDALEKEATMAWKIKADSTATGLGDIIRNSASALIHEKAFTPLGDLKNPFEGLLAQRVGCLKCGYVEAVRMQSFTSLSLTLSSTWSCTLDACLDEFTSLETLDGVPCEKCTFLAIKAKLERILERPANSEAEQLSPALRDTLQSRLEAVTAAIEESDFSVEALKRCNIPKKNILNSNKTKQLMIAKPPQILVLHVNRSMFDMVSGGTRKNYAVVEFEKFFDLESWVVGNKSGFGLDPSKPMRLDGPKETSQNTRYVLRSVVAHYGSHGSGHYVCYRQTFPTKGSVTEETDFESHEKSKALVESKPKPIWWRCSDCDVRLADEDEVLATGNAFMLYYERIAVDSWEIEEPSPKAAPLVISSEADRKQIISDDDLYEHDKTENDEDDDVDDSRSTSVTSEETAETTATASSLSSAPTPCLANANSICIPSFESVEQNKSDMSELLSKIAVEESVTGDMPSQEIDTSIQNTAQVPVNVH